jgi:hypothetical protein
MTLEMNPLIDDTTFALTDQHVVVSGDLLNGFTAYGLFDDEERARQWADGHCDRVPWWVLAVRATHESQAAEGWDYLLLAGSFAHGFDLYGTFLDEDSARDFGERYLASEGSHVLELAIPKDL